MLEAGARLGAFEILGPLGKGGMGEVYRARDTDLGREVAVKVLPDHLAQDDRAAQRFEREAKALAALSDPHILTVFAFGKEESMAYAVTELLEGRTLRQCIEAEGAFPWRSVLDIVVSIADGLGTAHSKGIVHRDIKPSNLFLTAKGEVKILDFGLAKLLAPRSGSDVDAVTPPTGEFSDGGTATGAILGTASYMSPEQAMGISVTAASDVFSLGCVLQEMVTGVSPFKRPSRAETHTAILRDSPVPFGPAVSGVPSELERIALKALSKDPSARYPSAVELQDDLVALQNKLAEAESDSLFRVLRRPRVAIPVLMVVALAAGISVLRMRRASERERARQQTLPEVMRLIGEERYARALALAREIESVIPDDLALAGLWDQMSNTVSVETDPPGAKVFLSENGPEASKWRLQGSAPVVLRIPLGGFRLRVEKDGFEPRELLSAISYPETDGSFKPLPSFSTPIERTRFSLSLDPIGSVPARMIAVDGGTYRVPLSIPGRRTVTLAPFFIDRTEVTNAQFKEFVDAGGYERREFWRHEFRKGGKALTWEEAIAEYVDTTGRTGPAAWELGLHPEDHDSYPVGGVSWYEAAAYAAFRGNSLPTIHHWMRAALPGTEHTMPLVPEILPLSNFGRGGPAPVGSFPGIGVSGAVDLAGNLREWCWNAAGDRRYVLGGAWSEPLYAFTDGGALDPFDRSALNGFRTMRERGAETSEELLASIQGPAVDFSDLQPISDEAWAIWTRMFAYDATAPLEAVLESTDETPSDWRRESVSIAAAYGEERFVVHLDLPTRASPPYQPIVYVPGSNALEQMTFQDAYWERLDFVPRSGRVLVRPVLADLYERSSGIDRTLTRQEMVTRHSKWVQDLGRTLDYLESRGDVDLTRTGYMGLSMGARMAPLLVAAEERFKVAVLIAGGMSSDQATASVTPRVDVPVLMLNGRYDYVFPVETEQKPLFDYLGTPQEHKRHVVFEAGHLPLPRGEMIREILDWLDHYQNPVAPLSRGQ